MKIKFLGTRGYIDVKTRRHSRHTSTLIIFNGKKVMIDCGIDWSKKVWKIKPDAIVITHAHPDHAWGLKEGSPCPVYATKQSWQIMHHYNIKTDQRYIIKPYVPTNICGVIFEAFTQIHSIKAPAVGYKITAQKKSIYYSGDIVYIKERKKALRNIQLYIGDGATINRPMIRKKDDQLFGHTTIRTQLTWCQKENVPWAIITHCGTQLVAGGRKATDKIKAIAKQKGIKVITAYDGLTIEL